MEKYQMMKFEESLTKYTLILVQERSYTHIRPHLLIIMKGY